MSLPLHYHSRFLGNSSNLVCFEVFILRESNEFILVGGLNNYRHSLLRFGDSKLCAVKTLVLLADCIEIDRQTVCKLTDSYRNTACAEVVAALDKTGNLRVTEKTLDLSFLGGVSFLYLGCHGGKRFHIVGFRRACCASDTVTAGSSAKKNYYVACCGTLTAYVVCRRCCNNSSALKTLCHVSVVINLCYVSCRKTDLVAV